MFGLICLGVVLACDAGEGGESQITELMGTSVIAEGTYQLDNLSQEEDERAEMDRQKMDLAKKMKHRKGG